MNITRHVNDHKYLKDENGYLIGPIWYAGTPAAGAAEILTERSAAGFVIGCEFNDTTNKLTYKNTGTETTPVWSDTQAIAASEISLADGKMLLGAATGLAAAKTMSGDVTITREGVTSIGAKKVTAGMTAIADGKILVGGSGGAGAEQTMSGDATLANTGALTIANKAVTLAKMNDMATASLLGRSTAGTGAPEVLSASTARTLLNVADGANNYSHPNHTGDVTSTGDGATVIANSAVTAAKLADAVQDMIPYVAISLADGANGSATATVQIKDAGGNNLAQVCLVRFMVSTAEYGVAAANVTQLEASAGAILNETTTDIDAWVQTDATGLATLVVTNSANETIYTRASIGGKFVSTSVAVTGNA